ncbi:MAG: hypothetical protein KGZ81_07240 [Flavobacteriales bacterium]|nr:hypothetical protein [Flavobacteriales bacterium]
MATPAYRKNTSTFEFTNPHPKGIRTVGDCVFRAISIATGKSWLEVYDELTALGREALAPPNDKRVFVPYLDKIGTRLPVMTNGKRLTARQVALLSRDTYVVQVANHVVAVSGGKVKDTWDSGEKSAYVIWKIA